MQNDKILAGKFSLTNILDNFKIVLKFSFQNCFQVSSWYFKRYVWNLCDLLIYRGFPVPDCCLDGSEFELQLRYYVHVRNDTLGKGINYLPFPSMVLEGWYAIRKKDLYQNLVYSMKRHSCSLSWLGIARRNLSLSRSGLDSEFIKILFQRKNQADHVQTWFGQSGEERSNPRQYSTKKLLLFDKKRKLLFGAVFRPSVRIQGLNREGTKNLSQQMGFVTCFLNCR